MKISGAADLIFLARSLPELNTNYAIELAGGSQRLYEKTLRAAIRLLPSNIGQMDSLIRDKDDIEAFAVRVHGAKGSLTQIGCLGLAKLAQELEKAAKEKNHPYCAENYGAFREGLLRLYDALKEPPPQDGAPCSDTGDDGLHAAVLQAREAVLEYDALKASDILAPHVGRCFGGGTGELLSKAAEALGAFRHKQALACIEELLAELHAGEGEL